MTQSPAALVTGACSGIGFALATELAARGHPLIVISQRQAALEDAAERLARTHGVSVRAIAIDLARPTAASASCSR